MAQEIHADVIDDIVYQADKDHNGELDFNEFLEMVCWFKYTVHTFCIRFHCSEKITWVAASKNFQRSFSQMFAILNTIRKMYTANSAPDSSFDILLLSSF